MTLKVKTGRFAVSGKDLALALFLIYGTKPLGIALAFFSILLAMGIFLDLRFAVIGLMVLFLLIPLELAFLYFFHALTPLTSRNVLPHDIETDSSGNFLVTLWTTRENPEMDGLEEWVPLSRLEVDSRLLRVSKILTRHVAFVFCSPDNGFLLIPLRETEESARQNEMNPEQSTDQI